MLKVSLFALCIETEVRGQINIETSDLKIPYRTKIYWSLKLFSTKINYNLHAAKLVIKVFR